jgi:hypothetical protein
VVLGGQSDGWRPERAESGVAAGAWRSNLLRIPAKEIEYSELMPIIFRLSEAKQFHVA